MKKIIVISIVIAAAIAIFAAVALSSDLPQPEETVTPAVEQKQIDPKGVKFSPQTLKTPKIRALDKEKLKKAMKKMKEKQEKDPNYHKKGESCGE